MNPTVGILAYGSLIANPGEEIAAATIATRAGITTPFKVEFARKSNKRHGAPTLVPVKSGGARVQASLFVLNVSEPEATDRLYRREINEIGSGKRYELSVNPGPNTVVIRRLENFEGIDIVLYTEIAANISGLDAKTLAELAIESARELADGRDGISYLIVAKNAGIETPLSGAFEEEVRRQVQTVNLEEALRKVRMG